MSSFRCESVQKAFGGTSALVDCSLDLPDEGIVAIVGPNGAGKTTLLNVLTGFEQVDAGRCFLGATDITRLPPHRIAKLGVARTFQDLRLIQQMSVLDNVMLAAPNQRGEALLRAIIPLGVGRDEATNRANAGRLLEMIGLRGHATNPAAELSYGQQKLLALACCLATGARIILLDEPAAGIDTGFVAQLVVALHALRREGKLIVFIEHDLPLVYEVAEQVLVMGDGRLVGQGRPPDVLSRPDIVNAYVG